MDNKHMQLEIICPKTQIRNILTFEQLYNYVPLTMKEINEEEGFNSYICQVSGYNYFSFKNKFSDEPWLNPFDEFIDKLKVHNEYTKLFGDVHTIMTGESIFQEKKRKNKKQQV